MLLIVDVGLGPAPNHVGAASSATLPRLQRPADGAIALRLIIQILLLLRRTSIVVFHLVLIIAVVVFILVLRWGRTTRAKRLLRLSCNGALSITDAISTAV